MLLRKKSLIYSLGIGILVSIFVILITILGKLEALELMSLDWRFFIRGEADPGKEIVIVTWDDDTFKELKHRYQDWKRSFHAQVIRNLTKYGAKVIGFDIIVEDPDKNPKEDELLAQATKLAGNVVFDCNFTIEETKLYSMVRLNKPIEILTKNKADYGFVNLLPDSDSFVRSVLLVKEHQGFNYLSFPLKVLSKYLGVKDDEIKIEPNKISLKNITIPTSLEKYMQVNFRGRERTFKTVPYYQVYEDIASPSFFKDKIVLVGMFSETVPIDVHPTPFSRLTRVRMSGVEILANTIYTVLHQDFLRKTNRTTNFLIIIFLGILTGILNYHLGFLKGFFISLLEAVILLIIIIYLFNSNIIIPMVSPFLTIFLTYGGVMLYRGLTEEREKKKIRSTFARYVTQQVVQEILENPEAMALGGKRKECTILFSDIRGFTSMSEKMSPEEVVGILNEYFTVMVNLVFEYGGTLDKFIGDAIMAVWGAPISHPDDVKRAVLCALKMGDELKKLQEKWQSEGKPAFDTGIGINTGEVVVGNIGSLERMDYTVIGDNVNLASRLESLNKEYKSHILISEMTYNKIKDIVEVRPIEEVQVKGKTEKIMIYEVVGKK